MTAMPPSVLLHSVRDLAAGFAPDAPDVKVTDLTLDSRAVVKGGLFLACKGTRQHGLAFLPEALKRGAAAVLWEPAEGVSAPGGVPAAPVAQLFHRAGEIAARFFAHPSRKLHCVGITGTDGKTSTAYLIAQALERLGQHCLYVGTLGSGRPASLAPGDQTTPDPVNLQRRLQRAVNDGDVAVAMEVSSHALDQARVAGVEFHTAVLTNVGRDHLDYHGTVEQYAAAKHKLFERPELRATVFNRDDAFGKDWSLALARRRPVTLYGVDGNGPHAAHYVIGRRLALSVAGIAFDVDSHAGDGRIDSRLLGRFNAYNLLAALAALLEHGVELRAACDALSNSTTVPGRIEGFRGPKAAPLVVVDYAHTPQALTQVLQAVRAHCAGSVWAVFGCGGDRDRGKRPLMGAAAAQVADRLIVTDDNPRSDDPALIAGEILAGIPAGRRDAVRLIHSRADAIATAVREAADGDVVVVAGKGHEDYQIYGAERRSFSDRAFVADLVGQPPSGEARGQY